MWHNTDQNTDEWLQLRCGKLTGSAIAKVMANEGKPFGDPAKKLAVDLAIQQITGKVQENGYRNSHMERGHEQEPIARMLYEEETFCTVTNGGFYDNGFTGCSPDGIVANGLVEIKSVIASVQYKTLKRGAPDPAYKWQIIFNLKETEKDWLDYISYCAEFPEGKQLIIHRVYKEQFEEEFKRIDERVEEFKNFVDAIKADIYKHE